MNNYFVKSVLLLTITLLANPVYADDNSLYGVWESIEYKVNDTVKSLKGLMVITPGYLVASAVFDNDGDGKLDANATSGPITVANGIISYMQWIQLHYRPGGAGDSLKENVLYDINYTIEDDLLIFHFPSGNKYISKRLAGLQG